MADYRQTLHQAVFRFPLAAAFALLPSRSERLGHTASGPGHGDQASLSKREEVSAWLKAHYQIVPTPKPAPRKK